MLKADLVSDAQEVLQDLSNLISTHICITNESEFQMIFYFYFLFGHTTTSTLTKRWLFSRGEDGIVQKFTIARRRIRNGMDVVDKELQYCRCCCCLLWRCALTQSALKGQGWHRDPKKYIHNEIKRRYGLNTLSDQLAFDLETVNSEKGNWKGEPKHSRDIYFITSRIVFIFNTASAGHMQLCMISPVQ